MKIVSTLSIVVVLLVLTACSSSSNSGNSDSDSDTGAMPNADTTIRFDQLVSDIFDQTSDTGNPISTNQLSIEFSHDESIFDHLF